MSKEKKKTKSAKYMSCYETLFACPICHASMKVVEGKSLSCKNHHTFDIAKQGYVNLTTSVSHTKYSRELFEARRDLMVETNFFKPVTDKITEIISQEVSTSDTQINIVDMGCGEGTHLTTIGDSVSDKIQRDVLGVGIDLAKEGIIEASKNYSEKIWVVADLAHTPFQNDAFHVILNILSPSNYAEFNRLLKPEGLVIKVVPQSHYLKELREHLYKQTEKESYSNEEPVNHFKRNYRLIDKVRLTYTVILDSAALGWLVQMTPLAWNVSKENLEALIENEKTEITIDLEILVGKQTVS